MLGAVQTKVHQMWVFLWMATVIRKQRLPCNFKPCFPCAFAKRFQFGRQSLPVGFCIRAKPTWRLSILLQLAQVSYRGFDAEVVFADARKCIFTERHRVTQPEFFHRLLVFVAKTLFPRFQKRPEETPPGNRSNPAHGL